MSLWRRLLSGSEWSQFLELLSPALFDVVSPRQLSLQATELAKHWFDPVGARVLVDKLEETAVAVGLDVRIVSEPIKRSWVPFRVQSPSVGAEATTVDGNHVLQFFFFQIYASDTLFLDFRANRFHRANDDIMTVFRPLPLWVKWRPDFVQGIRQLYDGFYRGEDGLYEQAIRDLGIAAARDVFERAFGGPRKHACSYSVAGFRETFHEVFLRCRASKVAFHPDFVTLGIALATLYDHLETLGASYDVAAQYERIQELLVSVPSLRE